MKILLMNSDDGCGGAARAAFRLNSGLRAGGANSHLLVQKKYSDDEFVHGPSPFLGFWIGEIRPHLDALPTCLYPGRTRSLFSSAILPERLTKKIAGIQPDIIHLHWICNGFMNLETLRHVHRPIVWTLHDFWAFTGGCHLPYDCRRFQESCGSCPELGSGHFQDLSHWLLQRKRKIIQSLELTVVAPSQWLAQEARSSSLLAGTRIEVIPNGLDLERFKPADRHFARAMFSLPQDKILLLFSGVNAGNDHNKGAHLLAEAVHYLLENGLSEQFELVIVGRADPAHKIDWGIKVHYLGCLSDEASLCLAYACADVLVLPSLFENLPYTIMEAMACGIPCVAFGVGGIPELITHGETGLLARPYNIEDFARCLVNLLKDSALRSEMSLKSREWAVDNIGMPQIARRHLELYRRLAP